MNDDLYQTCKAAVQELAKQRAEELLNNGPHSGFEIENDIIRTLNGWVADAVSEHCREGISTGRLVPDKRMRLTRNQ